MSESARRNRFQPDSIFRDIRHGVRVLARSRGFSATVLLTLALCMGAVVVTYGAYDSVVLEPLPFSAPDRLVALNNSYPGAGVERASNGVPDYYDRKTQVEAFSDVAVLRGAGITLQHGELPERVRGMIATPTLFDVLQVDAYRGRLFSEEEGEALEELEVLLSYDLWQRLYAGDDSALGTDLRLDGRQYKIVGVLPPGFAVPPSEPELVIPVVFAPEDRADDRRHSNNWQMLARLEPDASITQAQAQIDALNERNLELLPQLKPLLLDAGFHTVVDGYQELLIEDVKPVLALLLGGALFVLLIGCVNIANLILVRASSRQRDLATRCALGAGRVRLAGQLVTENLLLAVGGGALGLLLGSWGLRLLMRLGADQLPRGTDLAVDGGAVLWTLGIALAIGLVLGLIPVVQLFRDSLSSIFRQEGRAGSAGRGAVVSRNLLVAAQVAFAFVLLIGAGFLLASFVQMIAVDPGFEPEGVITAQLTLPEARYGEDADVVAFYGRLLERVRAVPGVARVGLTDSIPFGGNTSSSVITVEGYELRPGESVRAPYQRIVTPGYFDAMGIPVLEGRPFDGRDTADSQQVVIVDRWMAEKYWPGRDPIGGRLYQGVPEILEEGEEIEWKTVVGVVEEVLITDPAQEVIDGAYYFPATQESRRYMALAAAPESGDPEVLAPSLRQVLRTLDPELPLYDVQTMQERIDEQMLQSKMPMLLAAVFAGVALFLAAVGIYGVLAYSVVQRTRELGIRLALGSTSAEVFRMVLRQGVLIVGVGLASGLVGAFFLTRWIESILYGVSPFDPVVFLAVAGLLTLVALVATAVPALRATRIDPVVALASE